MRRTRQPTHRRRLVAAAAAIALFSALLAGACGSRGVDRAESFLVAAPDGWTLSPENIEGLDGIYYIAPGATSSLGDNVNVIARPVDGLTLSEFNAQTLSQIADGGGSLLVESLAQTEMDGEVASSVVWEGPINARFWSTWTIRDDRLYVFTYRANPDTYDANVAEATEILESFEFTS